jgi:uncharacterized GH25 family protein
LGVARTSVSALTLLAAMAISARATAHDHWLVPDPLVTSRPTDVTLRLYVGDEFVADEEKPFERARIVAFRQYAGSAAAIDLDSVAKDGAIPFFTALALPAGMHLFAIERNAAHIELPAAKFEDYLREEGLDAVVAERARRGESGLPGRETYERAIKALVVVGDAHDETFGVVTGSAIELVPASDPTVTDGSPLRVAARFRAAPLVGTRVELLTRADGRVDRQVATTDASGNATFVTPAEGVHLLRAVHMVRCDGCSDADWHSYWTAYAFASAPRGATIHPPPMTSPRPTRRWPVILAVTGIAVAALVAMLIVRRSRRRPVRPA